MLRRALALLATLRLVTGCADGTSHSAVAIAPSSDGQPTLSGGARSPAVAAAPETSTDAGAIATEAARRLLGAAPTNGAFPIFISVGAGAAIARVAEDLRRELARHPRMVLSRVESSDAPPIADPSVSTGHVHPVEFRLVPPPVLVVVLSESKGVLYVAARDGSDPLGPATNGWLWVLTAP